MWDFPFSNPFRFYWCLYLCSAKSTDSSTLKHHNFFQHYNKRKGTHTFVLRLLIFRIFSNKKFLNPVTSTSVRDLEKLLWFFQRFVFQRKVKSWFFVTFNIFLSHIFHGNFIEFPQVLQKIWKFSCSILSIFKIFLDYFTFPCYKETDDISTCLCLQPALNGLYKGILI